LWDTRGVLSLYGSPAKPGYFCRVFQVVLTSTARLETGGCQMPLSFMLMVPADFCRQDLCFVNCMCHGKLIGFLVQ
jgi:hypothetical protein